MKSARPHSFPDPEAPVATLLDAAERHLRRFGHLTFAEVQALAAGGRGEIARAARVELANRTVSALRHGRAM